eukprot:6217662-Amphidinium_carterae.1
MSMCLGGNATVKVRHIVCDRGVPENVMHYLSGKWVGCSMQSSLASHGSTHGDEAMEIDGDV